MKQLHVMQAYVYAKKDPEPESKLYTCPFEVEEPAFSSEFVADVDLCEVRKISLG